MVFFLSPLFREEYLVLYPEKTFVSRFYNERNVEEIDQCLVSLTNIIERIINES